MSGVAVAMAPAPPETLIGRPDGVPVGARSIEPEAVTEAADVEPDEAIEVALMAALDELLPEAEQERS